MTSRLMKEVYCINRNYAISIIVAWARDEFRGPLDFDGADFHILARPAFDRFSTAQSLTTSSLARHPIFAEIPE